MELCYISVQENYLGEFQKATDFVENPKKMKDVEASYVHVENPDSDEKAFDSRVYRPFAVTVSVTLHDIQAHLAKVGHCLQLCRDSELHFQKDFYLMKLSFNSCVTHAMVIHYNERKKSIMIFFLMIQIFQRRNIQIFLIMLPLMVLDTFVFSLTKELYSRWSAVPQCIC